MIHKLATHIRYRCGYKNKKHVSNTRNLITLQSREIVYRPDVLNIFFLCGTRNLKIMKNTNKLHYKGNKIIKNGLYNLKNVDCLIKLLFILLNIFSIDPPRPYNIK